MPKLDCHVFGIPQPSATHAHEYAHILLPLTDELIVQIDGIDYHVTSKHIAFVAPKRAHHCMCPSEIIMINIPQSMIKKEELEIPCAQVCLPLTGSMVALSELIKQEVQRNPEGDSVRYLYYYLYDKLVESNGIKSLRYIHEHYSEDISISELARLENYNVSYYTDWFKKQTGSAPSHYIRKLRIDKAKELLTSTRYRLIDIAMQVGYAGNAAFSRAFRACEGVNAAQYRHAQWEEK